MKANFIMWKGAEMKVEDIVMQTMHQYEQFDIDVGCNSFFTDVYDLLEQEPKYHFEKWKSNVLTRLLKDNRFYCNSHALGLRGHKMRVVKLKEEYRR